MAGGRASSEWVVTRGHASSRREHVHMFMCTAIVNVWTEIQNNHREGPDLEWKNLPSSLPLPVEKFHQLLAVYRSVVSSGYFGFLHQKTDFIIISPP